MTPPTSRVLPAQGLGGSGETVVASAMSRGVAVSTRLESVGFLGVGQDGDLRDLQQSNSSTRAEVQPWQPRRSPLSTGADVGSKATRRGAGRDPDLIRS